MKEKVFLYAGNECKSGQGKVVLIFWYLYGLKSSSISCRKNFSGILGSYSGFKSSLSEPYFWYRAAVGRDVFEYYSYILVYVDEILIIDQDPIFK